MQCKNCGSENIQIVADTSGKIKKRGCLMTLVWIVLAIFTCGLILIIPILMGGSKGKIETKTKCVCMNCSNYWFL